ncbi:MAG TPA: hypothetical protein VG889_00995 [Rhizomicrobium sp.]|nr:hypothetical protein [Rhizomicrobium sp.]
MSAKDSLLLLAGAALSFLTSLLASFVLGPFLQIFSHYQIIRLASFVCPRFLKTPMFRHRRWLMDWNIDGEAMPSQTDGMTIRSAFDFIVGEVTMTAPDGAGLRSFLVARVTDNRYVTGRWYDEGQGRYFGMFQLIISPTQKFAAGKWCGTPFYGPIRSGAWLWRKDS